MYSVPPVDLLPEPLVLVPYLPDDSLALLDLGLLRSPDPFDLLPQPPYSELVLRHRALRDLLRQVHKGRAGALPNLIKH